MRYLRTAAYCWARFPSGIVAGLPGEAQAPAAWDGYGAGTWASEDVQTGFTGRLTLLRVF